MSFAFSKRFVFLSAAAIASAGVVCFVLLSHSGPAFKNRPLSWWVEQHYSSPENNARAAEAIRAIGTNALPFLLAELQSSPSSLLRSSKPLMIRIYPEFVQRRYGKIWMRHDAAVQAFKVLGTNAMPALPQLISLLGKNAWAHQAIAAIGDPAVPTLANLLESGNPVLYRGALDSLALMRTSRSDEFLTSLMEAPDPQLRAHALRALWFGRVPNADRTELTLRALTDPSPVVTNAAITLLSRIRLGDAPAVEEVFRASGGTNSIISPAADWLIAEMMAASKN